MRALARAVLGGALSHDRGRLALSVAAIALGVALGFAVALVNASAIGEFSGAMKTLSGEADLEVRGGRAGFSEELFPRLARDPDIAVASPVVEVDARIDGREEALRIYGVDAFRAAQVTPALVGSASDALDLLRPGVAFVTPAAATALGIAQGDTLAVQSGLRAVPLAVAGLAEAGAGQRFAVMDIAAAQDAFGRAGTLSRIDLRVRPGAGVDAVRERLAATMPPGVAIAAPGDNAAQTARLSRTYRVNLNVLALVGLFTGGLLVFSTQALSVVRRRAQLALLRTLGLTRAQVLRWLVAEGVLVGVAGSTVGLGAGYAISYAVMRGIGADLGAGYFRGVAPRLDVDVPAAIAFALCGIAVAALGSYVPAVEASRAAPAAALKAGDDEQAFARLRPAAPGLWLLAAGLAMTLLPAIDGLPLAGYAAIALMLVGTLLLLPRIHAIVLRVVPTPRAAPVALALAQLRGAPGHASVSLATIVASVSVMVSMAIMVASFRQSLDEWLLRVLPADLYVRAASAGDSAFLTPPEQDGLARIPGLARVSYLRAQSVLLDASHPRVALLARDLPRDDPGAALPLVGDAHDVPRGEAPPAWISEAVADFMGWRPGARVTIPLAGASRAFTVAGVWRDYARQQGAIVIDRSTYVALTGDTAATDAALWLAEGARLEDVRAGIEASVPGASRLAIATPGEIRALSLRVFDRTFAVTYALLAVSVVIGIAGLSSSFGALTLARRREFGMLRHIGMRRRQVAAMLAVEGLVVGAIGLAVGLALGFAMSLVLVHVVNRQSFHWGMSLHVPWASLATLAGALLVAAVVTTVAAGRRAMTGDAIRAVKEDW